MKKLMLIMMVAIVQLGCTKQKQIVDEVTKPLVIESTQAVNASTNCTCNTTVCPSDMNVHIYPLCYEQCIPCESPNDAINVAELQRRVKTTGNPAVVEDPLKMALTNTFFVNQVVMADVLYTVRDYKVPNIILYSTNLKRIGLESGITTFGVLGDVKLSVSQKSAEDYAKTKSLVHRKQLLKEAFDQFNITTKLKL